MSGLPCADASADELVAILNWEFKRLPIIHNGPLKASEHNKVDDDTDVLTTFNNYYAQNVCQRYLMGVQNYNNFYNEGKIMTKYMHYP